MWRRTAPPPVYAARYKNTTDTTTSTSVPIAAKVKDILLDDMKTLMVCSVQLCLVVLCMAVCLAEPKEPKRSRLSGNFGLTPFLRSGRGSDRTWDATTDMKRRIGKMVSFPRIGRSESWPNEDDSSYGAKRPGGSTSGMWFGPRLGRVQKRSDEYTPWSYVILSGDGPVSRQVHYTPRLGRESEETVEEQQEVGDVEA